MAAEEAAGPTPGDRQAQNLEALPFPYLQFNSVAMQGKNEEE